MFVFRLCKDLHVDDPVHWFNSVPSTVLDAWMAYYTIINEMESGEEKMSPNDLFAKLKNQYG